MSLPQRITGSLMRTLHLLAFAVSRINEQFREH